MKKILVLATSKGGAGKSTLVRSLSAHYIISGFKAAVIDADPQGSIVSRHDPDGKLQKLYVVAEPEEQVSFLVEDLKKTYSPIIIDTGGFRNRTTIRALVSADLAIIPLKPSADDVIAAIETHDLIKEINETPERAGRPIKYRMILTMTQQGTIISKQVRRELDEMGYLLLKSELFHRVAYPESAINGLSPNITDPDGAASRDIASIASEILKL
ncbi:MAG: ParA family protein [Bacteriovorax sp.]|nr:ParA family protein [Bacteriovorax sp.]